MDYIPEITRDRLAADVIARMLSDRDRTSDEQIRTLLDYLKEHAFDPALSLSKAYRSCGIRSKYIGRVFSNEFGINPSQYVHQIRLEVGAELLSRTSLKIREISSLVGLSPSAFSEAFNRKMGERPRSYRARLTIGPDESAAVDSEFRQIIKGFNQKQAEDLMNILHSSHPDLELAIKNPKLYYQPRETDNDHITTAYYVSESKFEMLKAERLWVQIQGLEEARQRLRIKTERFTTSALFDFLKSITIKASRKNREDGLKLARLALDAAENAELLDLYGCSALRAQAWAWLAHAQRQVLDYKQAEKCILLAKQYLPLNAKEVVHAEVWAAEAALFWQQHKISEGLKLADKCIDFYKKAGDHTGLAEALTIKGNLLVSDRRHEEAIEAYSEILIILPEQPDSEMCCGASYNLATCYWSSGDLEEARDTLRDLNGRLEAGNFPLLASFSGWIGGRIDIDENLIENAISNLEGARFGFSRIKSKLASLVGLDLAIAYLKQGEVKKVLVLLKEVLATVKIWCEDPQFSDAYKVVQRSASKRLVTLESLINLRDLCDHLGHNPSSRALLGLKGMA